MTSYSFGIISRKNWNGRSREVGSTEERIRSTIRPKWRRNLSVGPRYAQIAIRYDLDHGAEQPWLRRPHALLPRIQLDIKTEKVCLSCRKLASPQVQNRLSSLSPLCAESADTVSWTCLQWVSRLNIGNLEVLVSLIHEWSYAYLILIASLPRQPFVTKETVHSTYIICLKLNLESSTVVIKPLSAVILRFTLIVKLSRRVLFLSHLLYAQPSANLSRWLLFSTRLVVASETYIGQPWRAKPKVIVKTLVVCHRYVNPNLRYALNKCF